MASRKLAIVCETKTFRLLPEYFLCDFFLERNL